MRSHLRPHHPTSPEGQKRAGQLPDHVFRLQQRLGLCHGLFGHARVCESGQARLALPDDRPDDPMVAVPGTLTKTSSRPSSPQKAQETQKGSGPSGTHPTTCFLIHGRTKMGIYYVASTIIGFRVSTKDCYTTKSEPNCSHNPPPSVTYCPSCGRKVETRNTRSYRKEYTDDFRDEFVNHLPKGYVCTEHYDGQDDLFWIGYGKHADRSETSRSELKPYEEIKAEIIEMMKPFTDVGLFVLNDDDFAIWTLNTGS
jgi:hypothetical protein